MFSTRTVAALLALLALFGAVGAVAAVPDARIAIDGVATSSSEPVVGERTALNVSLSNSGGSPAAADVTSVRVFNAGDADDRDDDDIRDEATAVGALSAGDATDVTLWTRFDEPGEHRLTVEVVAEQEAADGDEETDTTVRVTRDVIVDVQPTEVALDVRTRPLSPADLQSDEDDQSAGGINLNGIDGLFGGGGGLQDADEGDDLAAAADSPVEVTVVNTGTATADRVSLTAVGVPAGGDDEAESTVEVGPFVVEDVAPGEERRVIVDLGPLDRRSAVTVTAAFRADTDRLDDRGADRTAESTVTYPVSETDPTVTDVTLRETADGVVVDANLGNAGTGEMTGTIVSIGDAPGVAPTPAGGEYFVGSLGASDFVGFDLTTAVNASTAETIPVRVSYTERGVRYTETLNVAGPEPDGDDDEAGGTLGRIGTGGLGTAGAAASGLALVGLVGALGVAVRTGRIGGSTGRRRDGSAP